MEIRIAERRQARIKMGFQGPSGSGKTYSSLLLAFGLCNDWTKIAVIDTENHSADLYAHLGNYNVINLSQPFHPEKYMEAIDLAVEKKMEVIIIDSISHEWDGAGGILETHGNMTGNSFTNWNKVTPRHNAFVQKMLQCPCHVIATVRSKQDYVISEKNGKFVPEKIGLKGVTRDGMDYEFTLMFEIDIKHQVTVSKDRTMLFVNNPSFIINSETGKIISAWCRNGVSLDLILEKISSCTTLDNLRVIHRNYPEYREKIKQAVIIRSREINNVPNLNH